MTEEVLQTQLAKLPVSESDISYFRDHMLSNPENSPSNLVAKIKNIVVGVIFYEIQQDKSGEIGVFIDREYRGQKIGSKLLEALITKTTNDLQVTIFAKNRSRQLYKQHGFLEDGPETTHTFFEGIYLPVQTLRLKRTH